ncbi:hypothetical protein ACHAW6_012897 [Cyclotella cf. meneghiniana]
MKQDQSNSHWLLITLE